MKKKYIPISDDDASSNSASNVVSSPETLVKETSTPQISTDNLSDEESDDEHKDPSKKLFSSPEPKKNSIGKNIKRSHDHNEKFFSYFDDSSSEEDEKEAEYDVITSFADFPITSAAYKSAFYSHALGIQILRSPLVRRFYHREKEKHLKYEDEMLNDQTIKAWLREHIEQTIQEVYFYLPGDNTDISKQLAEEFLNQYEEIISQLIDAIILDKNLLFSNFNKKTISAELFKATEGLLAELYTYIRYFVEEYNFEDIEFAEANDFVIGQIEEAAQYEELRNRVIDSLRDDIDKFLSKLERTPTDRICKNQPSKTINKIKNLPDSPGKQATLDYINKASGAKPPDKVKQEIIAKTLHNALEQLADNIENDETSSLFDEVQDVLLANGLIKLSEDDIEPITENNIENEDFLSHLFGNLQKSKNDFYRENGVERIILPEGHIFDLSGEDNFLPKFLATLNICNRSARRHLRNNGDDELERLIEEEYHRAWKFPQSERLVTDNHKFTRTGKRNDETSELGSYSTVLKLINGIKKTLNDYKKSGISKVKNKDIALWIRRILQGDELDTLVTCDGKNIEIEHYARLIKKIKFDLVKITYLLFGCEVVRNPASLIHQQMMLDLIIDDKISWKNAIDSGLKYKDKSDGGEMPMSMKKAVESARMIHNKFLSFMPEEYMYDPAPTEASVREAELLQREHNITEKWFKHFFNQPALGDKEKIEILVEQIVRWYGIHLLWYTGDQINQLLQVFLANEDAIMALPPVPLGSNNALRDNILNALGNLDDAAVLPLNLNNNHWVGLVFRLGQNEEIHAIYNDPMGNTLNQVNRNILENYIGEVIDQLNQEFQIGLTFTEIIDLELAQQTNGHDCGPITVNNLVRLALAENIDYTDHETIIQSANLISSDSQDLNIRQRHSEILLMGRNLNGSVTTENADLLDELLVKERQQKGESPIGQMASLGMDDNLTTLKQENSQAESEDEDLLSEENLSSGNLSPSAMPSLSPSSIPSFASTPYPGYTTTEFYEQRFTYENSLLSGENKGDFLHHFFDFK